MPTTNMAGLLRLLPPPPATSQRKLVKRRKLLPIGTAQPAEIRKPNVSALPLHTRVCIPGLSSEEGPQPMEITTTRTAKTGFNDLPQELQKHIFSFLMPRQLLRLEAVCLEWYWLLQEPGVWERVVFKLFRVSFVCNNNIHSSVVSHKPLAEEERDSYIYDINDDNKQGKATSDKIGNRAKRFYLNWAKATLPAHSSFLTL